MICIADCESTGLLVSEPGGITQFSARLFEQSGGSLRQVDEMSGFNDPGIPIPQEITSLTGITDMMVAGHSLNPLDVEMFLARADIVIAHNAVFDRAWLRKHGVRDTFRWGCSLTQIDWTGMPCRHLQHLAFELGLLNEPMRHDAQNDTKILVGILSLENRLQELLDNAAAAWNLIIAYGSPYDGNVKLKSSRKWHWSPPERSKVWWTVVRADAMEETKVLLREVYPGKVTAKMKAGIDPLDPDLKERYNL